MVPVVSILSVALMVGFSLAYYGKERMNYFTPEEIASTRWLYDHAPYASLIVSPTPDYPWAFAHYERYDYGFLDALPPETRRALARSPMPIVEKAMGSGNRLNAYFIETRSTDVAARYSAVFPPGALSRLHAAMDRAPTMRLVYRNRDVSIYHGTLQLSRQWRSREGG